MSDSEMFRFEKNRYYYGKMLTSEDFTAEQHYMDRKRNFLNQMVLGQGILCGLQVYNLDDLSVLVESGAAIDGEGREIVIRESAVHKLSAVKGYEELHSERAGLYIRYREEGVKPVYTPNGRENQDMTENNRIREGYELFLRDESTGIGAAELDSEFFVESMLVKEEDFYIKLRVPAKACRKRSMKIILEISQKAEEERSFSVEGVIKMPGFLTADGGHELRIQMAGSLARGEKRQEGYWVFVPDTPLTKTHLLIEGGDLSVCVGERKAELSDSLDVEIYLTDEPPESLVRKETGKKSLELLAGGAGGEGIRLAVLHLRETKTGYLIRQMEGAGAGDYIPVPANESEKEWYLSFYKEGPTAGEQKKDKEEPQAEGNSGDEEDGQQSPYNLKEYTAEGVLEIPLEARSKKGRIYYSEEVVHGLGPGSVYVAAGTADVSGQAGLKPLISTVTYGENALFAQLDVAETWVETAVRVFRDKGTFQVAARVKGEQKTVTLVIPWTAIKMPESREEIFSGRQEKCYITPQTPTVRLRPKEKHYFGVEFHNMEPGRVLYELTDEKGGVMEPDGIYTAPARAGVYEIRIYREDQKEISTYAYAVVEKESLDGA